MRDRGGEKGEGRGEGGIEISPWCENLITQQNEKNFSHSRRDLGIKNSRDLK